jgi:hypothetical protein
MRFSAALVVCERSLPNAEGNVRRLANQPVNHRRGQYSKLKNWPWLLLPFESPLTIEFPALPNPVSFPVGRA